MLHGNGVYNATLCKPHMIHDNHLDIIKIYDDNSDICYDINESSMISNNSLKNYPPFWIQRPLFVASFHVLDDSWGAADFTNIGCSMHQVGHGQPEDIISANPYFFRTEYHHQKLQCWQDLNMATYRMIDKYGYIRQFSMIDSTVMPPEAVINIVDEEPDALPFMAATA